nr:hypothetical protein [Geminocystis herdmanii]
MVTKSNRLPEASFGSPRANRIPTFAKGGTKDTAMATPGKVSETSRRDNAKAPAKPVARAAIRSSKWGDVRIMIC